jgi:hypothetical protein
MKFCVFTRKQRSAKKQETSTNFFQLTQIPANLDIKGVLVSLDVVDPNGNPVYTGDVATDISGTF